MSTEVSLTTARLTDTTATGTTTYEGPAVRGTVGVGRNDDGSVGYHAGVSAQVAGLTRTDKLEDGGTVTYGVNEGVGAGFSVGGKTTEKGDPAACFQVSALFFTVGACLPVNRF